MKISAEDGETEIWKYKKITDSQRKFIEWVKPRVNRTTDAYKYNFCINEVLMSGEYLEDGNWIMRLNELRDTYLQEYKRKCLNI